jgi:hypothetical protein
VYYGAAFERGALALVSSHCVGESERESGLEKPVSGVLKKYLIVNGKHAKGPHVQRCDQVQQGQGH